ncbi:MAG: hypothetical protein V4675_13615 [Verrucomicrobiota bacterium]
MGRNPAHQGRSYPQYVIKIHLGNAAVENHQPFREIQIGGQGDQQIKSRTWIEETVKCPSHQKITVKLRDGIPPGGEQIEDDEQNRNQSSKNESDFGERVGLHDAGEGDFVDCRPAGQWKLLSIQSLFVQALLGRDLVGFYSN